MFGRLFVFFALLIGVGCSETSVPQDDQAASEQQKQLNDLADEVTRLRQESADKEAADAAAIREFERVIATRPAPQMTVQPTEAELKRARVLSAIEELAFDDRKTAAEIYGKIEKDILSLNVIEANFASCGNGSSALSQLFAERLFLVYKQGVPKEDVIEWNRFGYRRNQENWHFPIILSAATTLKLEDEFELLSVCRHCFSDGGTGLSRFYSEVRLLTNRDLKTRDYVMIKRLDDLKRQPLFKYILDDYLRWALSEEEAPSVVEDVAMKAAEKLKLTEKIREAERLSAEETRKRREHDALEAIKQKERKLELELRVVELNKQRGQFVPVDRSKDDAKDIADTWGHLQAKVTSNKERKPHYSVVADDVKTIVASCRSAKDRSAALSDLCRYFRLIVRIVHGLDGRISDADAVGNATAALNDFDQGIRIAFPGIGPNDQVASFLNDALNDELNSKIGVPFEELKPVVELRKKLIAVAGKQQD
jgi:hypothetical protein